jgi:electron transfer flavoprotein alpha subunit
VRTAAVPAVSEGGSAPIETLDAAEDPDVLQFKTEEIAQSDWPEQTSARIIISRGRSLNSAETFKTHNEPIGDQLGAALSASRAAMDASCAPND